MLNNEPEKPFWQELLLVVVPAIAAAVVVEVGETLRDYLAKRKENKDAM